jgi:hypothetical protein
VIAPASGAPAFPFLATPALKQDGRFSPDDTWIAYSSEESGRPEVYVRPVEGKSAAPTGKVQISSEGGEFPVWGPAGKEIFYMGGRGNIFAAETRHLGTSERVAPPMRLFKACPETHPFRVPLTGVGYDYSFDTYDGQRFLFVCRAEAPGRYTVVLNWELGK